MNNKNKLQKFSFRILLVSSIVLIVYTIAINVFNLSQDGFFYSYVVYFVIVSFIFFILENYLGPAVKNFIGSKSKKNS